MPRHPVIRQKDYLDAAQVFHWASRDHFVIWFTGTVDRHRRTEVLLPRLVAKGKLRSYQFGNRLVYCVPRRCRGKQLFIEHGLGCTEGLVRFWRADMTPIIIPERYLKGFGNVPEWGLKYSNGKLLLFEFCTRRNFENIFLVRGKITRYQHESVRAIEKKFDSEAIVLFVADVSRYDVISFVEKYLPEGPFLFTDYESFLKVPLGNQLITPIYIWGENGKEYPLRND